MSNSNSRSRRSLRSRKAATKKDEELFVQLPKFSKRLGDEEKNPESAFVKKRKQLLLKFLSQSNCQRWIWYEFMDSPIDKAILASTYSWHDYVSNYFSRVETRLLPQRCWHQLRRSLGKAGRYSPAFIDRERNILEDNRHIVHQLQQRKLETLCEKSYTLQLLPMQVPMPLAPSDKVNGLLCAPYFAQLTKGRIISYDQNHHTYLVKFKINGKIESIAMPDCMVQAREEYETVPSAAIVQDYEQKQQLEASGSPEDRAKAMLVDALLQLNKLVEVKRNTVDDMASMNEEVQISGMPPLSRRESKQTSLREKLQQRHAANIMTLHRVNAEILEPLRLAHKYVVEYEQHMKQKKGVTSDFLLEKCYALAEVDIKAATQNIGNIQAEDTRMLILRLQTLLHLCGEIGRGNDTAVDAAMENVVVTMLDGLPRGMEEEVQEVLKLIRPLNESIQALAQKEDMEDIDDMDDSDMEMDL